MSDTSRDELMKSLVEAKKNVFKEILAELLSANSMSQAELAEKTGLSAPLITSYLKGRIMPSFESMIRIAFVLGVDEGVFFRQNSQLSDAELMLADENIKRILANCTLLTGAGKELIAKASDRLLKEEDFLNRYGKVAKDLIKEKR